jgi:hypothetical protein
VLPTSSAGSSYLWSTGATTQSISVTTGTYTVQVTNASGCQSAAKCRNDSYSKRSTRNTKHNSKRINNLCAGGSVTLTSSAGSSYLLWSTGATTQSIPATNLEHILFK